MGSVLVKGYLVRTKIPTPQHQHKVLGRGLMQGPAGGLFFFERGTPVLMKVSHQVQFEDRIGTGPPQGSFPLNTDDLRGQIPFWY